MSVIYIAGNDLNYVTSATITSTTANSLFPDENVTDGQPWIPYICNTAANPTYLEANFGSAKATDFCSFHGHNVESGVTVTVRSGSSPGPSNVRATFPSTAAAYTFPALYKTFSTQTHRYWRLYFSGSHTNPTAIGTWVLGEYSTLSTVQMWGWKQGFIYPTQGGVSPNGQLYSSYRADKRLRTLEMSFRATTEAGMTEAKNLFEVTKYGEEPLVIVPDDTSTFVIHGRLVPPFTYTQTEGGMYKFNLKIIEDPIWLQLS